MNRAELSSRSTGFVSRAISRLSSLDADSSSAHVEPSAAHAAGCAAQPCGGAAVRSAISDQRSSRSGGEQRADLSGRGAAVGACASAEWMGRAIASELQQARSQINAASHLGVSHRNGTTRKQKTKQSKTKKHFGPQDANFLTAETVGQRSKSARSIAHHPDVRSVPEQHTPVCSLFLYPVVPLSPSPRVGQRASLCRCASQAG